MTTKKFVKEIENKLKSILNIRIEKMFDDYVLYKNAKRVGVLFNDTVLLIGTDTLHKTYPNLIQETSFDWGYYKLFHIDLDNLEKSIYLVYNDLYFEEEFILDISDIILPIQKMGQFEKIYTIHFLHY